MRCTPTSFFRCAVQSTCARGCSGLGKCSANFVYILRSFKNVLPSQVRSRARHPTHHMTHPCRKGAASAELSAIEILLTDTRSAQRRTNSLIQKCARQLPRLHQPRLHHGLRCRLQLAQLEMVSSRNVSAVSLSRRLNSNSSMMEPGSLVALGFEFVDNIISGTVPGCEFSLMGLSFVNSQVEFRCHRCAVTRSMRK